MHLDGFVFDFPDGYIGSGSSNSHLSLWEEDGELWEYNPDIIKQYITDVVHDLGDHRVAAFAEIYPDDWSVERGNNYGFDGLVAGDADNTGYGTLATAIQEANVDLLETTFNGEGGPDALRSQCFHSNSDDFAVPWTRFMVGTPWLTNLSLTENNYDCRTGASAVVSGGVVSLEQCFAACVADSHCEAITVGWNKRSAISEVDCYKLRHVKTENCTTTMRECEACPYTHSSFAVDAIAKTHLAVAVTIAGGNLMAVEQSADGAWWSSNDWPGRWDPALAKLQQTFESNAAFNLRSLRVQLPAYGIGHYAILRYDHSGRGSAAVAAFNFEAKASSVRIDLSQLSRVFGHRPTNLLTGERAAALDNIYTVEIPAHGMVLLGFEGLGVWSQHKNTACPNGWSPHLLSLDACLLECLGKDSCHGVSVEWQGSQTSQDIVDCQLHDEEINLGDCQVANGDFSAFVLSSPDVAPVAPMSADVVVA